MLVEQRATREADGNDAVLDSDWFDAWLCGDEVRIEPRVASSEYHPASGRHIRRDHGLVQGR